MTELYSLTLCKRVERHSKGEVRAGDVHGSLVCRGLQGLGPFGDTERGTVHGVGLKLLVLAWFAGSSTAAVAG